MADPNTSSRWCWKYETTNGTAIITAVDDVTYYFGEYDDNVQMWEAQTVENKILSYYVYNSRTPELISDNREFPTFKHLYNPTTVNFLVDILGKVADAAPDTIEALDTGYQFSKTIRFEEGNEGTNDRLIQAAGCYCVSVFVSHINGKPMMCEQEFAFQSIEDQGDRSLLTTVPTASGGETLLTYPNVIVTYDHGGGGEAILDLVNKVEYRIKQEYSATRAGTGTTQTVYKGKYVPIEIVLSGIFPTALTWNQFFDRSVKDYEIKHTKPNGTDYVALQFNNCMVSKPTITASKFKGWSNFTWVLKAEDVDVTFNWEGSNFSTHFVGEVV